MISSQQLREKYLAFFKEKKHAVIKGSSLIPENDPTVLFTTAGMHPLVPFLLGEKHPQGKRLANVQKSVRTTDIDAVGDQWHLSFFEMLGNWSLGDYFKKEALSYSFEFLTSKKWLSVPVEKISVSVFEGDKDAPRDEESAKIWKELGIPEERIFYFPKSENWWGPAGLTGPCGPCSEMFYDTGKPYCSKGKGPKIGQCNPSCSCGKFAEIWNDVFMEYNKDSFGKYVPLKQKNVDTGMGLERTTAILNGLDNVYETDLLSKTFNRVKNISSKHNLSSQRIIADHIRASVFILAEDISPSNVEQGYVLRRLIRRSIRHARILGITSFFCSKVAETVIETFSKLYPELLKRKREILSELEKEEKAFKNALEKGLKVCQKQIEIELKNGSTVFPAKTAFDLFQSYGFPFEMTREIASEKNLSVDENHFEELLQKHQALSRKGSEQRFKGGLADHSTQTTRLHTATHLLNASLKKVLGPNIHQKGSNITAERLRFDFPFSRKLSLEELNRVESLVNDMVSKKLEVKMEILSLKEAKKLGAEMVFGEKYGEQVKVYTVWSPKSKEVFSRELCGGPHVSNTAEIGVFKIVKEESVSAGVRRIKAVVE